MDEFVFNPPVSTLVSHARSENGWVGDQRIGAPRDRLQGSGNRRGHVSVSA